MPSKLRPLDALGLIRISTGNPTGTHTAPAVGGTHTPLPGSRLSSAGSRGSTRVAVASRAVEVSPTTFVKKILRSAPMPAMSKAPTASLPEIDSVIGTGTGSAGGGGGVGSASGGGVEGGDNWAKASAAFPSAQIALAARIDRRETRCMQRLLTACAVRLGAACKQETRRVGTRLQAAPLRICIWRRT